MRSTRRRLLLTESHVAPEHRAAYYTCVNRAHEQTHWHVYPMPLRHRLPTIPIPCRATDADVPLDLQAAIDRVYLEGGHDDIDYSTELDVPLSPADATWAAEVVAAARPAS